MRNGSIKTTTKLQCSFKYLLMDNVSLHVWTARVWQVWSRKLHEGVWPSVWHGWKHLWNRMYPLSEKQVRNTHASTLAHTCTWGSTDNYDITHHSKDSIGDHEGSESSDNLRKSRTELKWSTYTLVWLFAMFANFTENVNLCCWLASIHSAIMYANLNIWTDWWFE